MLGNEGRRTEERCPKDGATIVYNGNYFCENWAYPNPDPEKGECDWALPHPQETYEDQLISYKLCGGWERDSDEFEWITTRPKSRDN